MGHVQGIHGANCRHHHGPGDGENNPFREFDEEKNKKQYELDQKQRTMERRIRKTKRELQNLQNAIDKETDPVIKKRFEKQFERKSALLKKQNEAYNDFCEETGQRRLPERINIAKCQRSETAKRSIKAAKDYEKRVANPKKHGKMNIDTGGRRNEQPLTREQYAKAKEAARKQGYDGQIQYGRYSSTAFHGSQYDKELHFLVIGTDAYPAEPYHESPIGRISLDGCMAHEVVGHYEAWKKGTTQSSFYLEEAQACLRAAKFGIGITEEDRSSLFDAALEHLKDGKIDYDSVKHLLDIWER